MIDPIGIKPGAVGERRLTPNTPVVAVDSAARAAKPEAAVVAETGLKNAAREMAAKPPVDHERVERIKQAIVDGSFPIVPAKIADRIIAAQLQWLAK